MPFKYKAFISYKHADKEWAKAIEEDLRQSGISCFLDEESLRAGRDWDDQLTESLLASEHLIVLSSHHVEALDWVNEEINRFRTQTGSLPLGTGRRLIPVLLDTEAKGLGRIQSIDVVLKAKAYPAADLAHLRTTPLWTQLIAKIKGAVLADANAIPVCLAVLALSRKRFEELYDKNTEGFADKVRNRLASTKRRLDGAGAVAGLKESYGATPYDWKPFGEASPIGQILEDVKDSVNRQIPPGAKSFAWDRLGDDFFYPTPRSSARDLLRAMKKGLAVFVVDPLSLHDDDMVLRLTLLDQYFEDDKTAILVFASEVPEQHRELLKLVDETATSLFEHFYTSKLRRQYARFGFHICTNLDVELILRTTLGPHAYAELQAAASPFTTAGVPLPPRP